MKKLLLLAGIIGLSNAHADLVAEETYTATFSDFNKLDKMLICYPGHMGGFATPDTLVMDSETLGTGAQNMGDLVSFSSIGLEQDPGGHVNAERPYEKGCQPAIDQFKAAIAGKEILEVTVKRTVYKNVSTLYRPRRNMAGTIQSFSPVIIEDILEQIIVDIGGFTFNAYRTVNVGTR